MIVARLAWTVKGEKGEGRPTRRYTVRFQEEHWNKYEQILTERIHDIQATIRDKQPTDRLRDIQKVLTRVAAEPAGANAESKDRTRKEGEDTYNQREAKELEKGERKRESQRDQLFKWNRHLYHARRYTGGKEKDGRLWRQREIGQDHLLNKIPKSNRKARRAMVIEICEEQRASRAAGLLKGTRKEINTTSNTDALIHSLMSLGKGTGNVVIKVFIIIKKAGGNDARTQRGIAGVYKDDDSNNPIIRGPTIREEVHKIATNINKADTLDITAVKEF
eukprot:1911617-Pleurochrysis_carterae.AAC.3